MKASAAKNLHLRLGLVVLVSFMAVLGVLSLISPHDWQNISGQAHLGPVGGHPLGTNSLGQDIAARVEAASWSSLRLGLLVTAVAGLLGIFLGLLSGWFAGRWPDYLILWLIGVLEAIPVYLFVAALAYTLRGQDGSMELAMIATFWTTMARLIRAEVIRIKSRDFILAAHAIGLPSHRILGQHILPNALPVLLVQLSLIFITAIKAEVVLSFLGLGDHSGISWGTLIAESTQEVVNGHYMNFISASILLFMLIFAISLISDGLQTRHDPRQGVSA